MTPAEREAHQNRGNPQGASEIRPATVAALLAEFSTPADRAALRARRAAAALIRHMDARDHAAAAALVTRIACGADGKQTLDAVTAWVWRLEAGREAHRRVYQASPAWRTQHEPARPPAELGEAVIILAAATGVTPRPPRLRRKPGPAPTRPHGTPAAWKRHRTAGEYPCDLCVNAERDRKAAQREEVRRAAA